MVPRSFSQLTFIFLLLAVQPNSGCYTPWMTQGNGVGGANDVVTVHLPFSNGYVAQCTQGVNGAYSHQGNATKYDLDFDTPNNRDDLVLAPIAGTAYVHDDPLDGFGRHVNIDLHDGTYIILGHLAQIFVKNRTDVGVGQVIAFEGTTGHSDGDHVHMGRHRGNPAATGGKGISIDTLAVFARDMRTDEYATRRVREHVCSLSGGHAYVSQMPDVLSHPEGTLIKSPYGPDVFVLSGGKLDLFDNEAVFWSHNRSFTDVVTVSDREIDCYDVGNALVRPTQIRGGFDGTDHWLLVGVESDTTRYRQRVRSDMWQSVFASWGVYADSERDLVRDHAVMDRYPKYTEQASWRDGTLVREPSRPDVYMMFAHVAYPVLHWDVLARLGLASHAIYTVADGLLRKSVVDIGNCATGWHCLDDAFAERCGASLMGNFSVQTVSPIKDTAVALETDHVSDSADTDTGSDSHSASDTSHTDVPMDSNSGVLTDSASMPTEYAVGDLVLVWEMPQGMQASRITLSGVYAPQGVEQWWSSLAQTVGMSTLQYAHAEMHPGDYLRFSVEFVVGGQTSWSCLAPFPPGHTQGTVRAHWNGISLPVEMVGDPDGSPGCGLRVSIP